MKKSEQTREFIITRAAAIFNKKGYQATSLSDITAATGLTKGALYGNFGNKNEIAVEAFKSKYREMAENFMAQMAPCQSSLEKLLAVIRYYKTYWDEVAAAGGCAILNASVEVDDQLDYLRPAVQQAIKSWSNTIIRLIEDGQQEGQFKQTIDPVYYAQTIISMIEGGIMLSKILDSRDPLFNTIDRIEKIILTEMKC